MCEAYLRKRTLLPCRVKFLPMADTSAVVASAAPRVPDAYDALHAALANLRKSGHLAELNGREREIRRDRAEVAKKKNEDRKRQRLQDRLRCAGDTDLFQALQHRFAPKPSAKAKTRAKTSVARAVRRAVADDEVAIHAVEDAENEAVQDAGTAIESADDEERPLRA